MKNEVAIWANLFLNKRSFDRTKRDVKKSAEGIGEDAGESIASGIEKGLKRSSSRVRRAMEEAASATASHTRAVRELSRLEKDRAAVVAKAIRDEKLYTDAKSNHADITERLRRVEDAHARGRRTLTSATGETIRVERQLSVLRDELGRSTSDLNRTERDYARSKREALRSEKDFLSLSRDAERAIARREQALRRLESAEKKKSSRGGGSGGVVGGMLTDIPFVPGGRAGAVIGGGVLVVLGSIAEAAVTASQSLALLPAITAAAGAGFATLAIGTQGFGDAIKDMGDPEKFAEALQSLSPAAQQAALEIQSLVNGPLKALKMATQEALFDGVAQRLHDATGTFGPMIQGLTTSVAGSFNNMFGNFLGELSSANSLASINQIIGDITKAFQNLEPAVAPFTDAILKISETGASFLPGMAQGVTDLANKFSNFIAEAQQDGSLANFMQKGIDAAAALGQFILDLGQDIYEVFGNKSPEEFANTLDSVKGAVMGIAEVIVGASNAVNDFLGYLTPVADAVGGWENLFKIAIGAFVGAKMVSAVAWVGKLAAGLGSSGVAGALSKIPNLAKAATGALAAIKLPAALLAFLKIAPGLGLGLGGVQDAPSMGLPEVKYDDQGRPYLPGSPHDPTGGIDPSTGLPRKQATAPSSTRDSGGLPPSLVPSADQFRPHPGRAPFGSGQNPPSSYSPHAVPGPPDTRSDSNRIQDELNKLNPNDYMPSIPGAPSASSGYRNGPEGAGMYEVDPQEVQDAYQRVIEQGRDVRDAHMQLVALQRSGIATDLEILKAKEKVADEQYDFNNSQLKLTEAQIGKLEKVNKGMQDIGLALDDDFGASRGLAGLAENLVKFVASLAAAPVMGMLAPIAAQGDGRYGLTGMMSQPLGSGLATSANAYLQGAQGGYTTPGVSTNPTGGSASPSSNRPLSSSGVYPGDAALLAQTRAGDYVSQGGVGDLTQGIGDCTSTIEDLVNLLDGRPTAGRSMATGNAAEWLASRGFVQGEGGPGDFRVGYNSGHMQATLPGGTNWNWGSQAAAEAGGVGPSQGAYDPALTQRWYRPQGGAGLPVAPQAGPAAGPGSSGYVPQAGGGGTPPLIMPTGPSANTSPGLTPGQSPIGAAAQAAAGVGTPIGPSGLPLPGTVPTGGPLGTGFPNAFGPGGMPQSPVAGGPLGAGNSIGAPGSNGSGQVGTPHGLGPSSASYAPTTPSEAPDPNWSPQGGGLSAGGGFIGMAMNAASSAAGAAGNMFAPGSGQAASAASQMAMELINRSVKFGSQVAGTLVSGAQETLSWRDPDTGEDPLANSWLTRLSGALMGAKPAGSVNAGKSDKDSKVDPNAPQNQQQQGKDGQQKQGAGPPTVNIENFTQAPNRDGQQAAKDLALSAQTSWFGGG